MDVWANRKGIAAGRDVRIHVERPWDYKPCPRCESRFIPASATECRQCKQQRERTYAIIALWGVLIAGLLAWLLNGVLFAHGGHRILEGIVDTAVFLIVLSGWMFLLVALMPAIDRLQDFK